MDFIGWENALVVLHLPFDLGLITRCSFPYKWQKVVNP